MNRLVPPDATYHHNAIAGDTNAHSHLQAAIIGASETVPVKNGHLLPAPGSSSCCSTSTTTRASAR